MNDKIKELESFIRDNKIKYFHFESNNNKISLTKTLLTYRTGLDLMLMVLAGYFTYTTNQKNFDMIFTLVVWAILFMLIWSDFKYINKIDFDFDSRQMKVSSRNIFKRLITEYVFRHKGVYEFSEISGFILNDEGLRSKADLDIYVLIMKLKDSKQKVLASFRKEEQALYFSHFFSQSIKD
jgi:hypothetical protein